MLENSYFSIIGTDSADGAVRYTVRMMADHPVYAGHFPGNPVSPGVCNLQMVKECAQHISDCPLTFDTISQYRLSEIVSPDTHPQLDIILALTPDDTGYSLSATATSSQSTVLALKAHTIRNS